MEGHDSSAVEDVSSLNAASRLTAPHWVREGPMLCLTLAMEAMSPACVAWFSSALAFWKAYSDTERNSAHVA